ncbi:helix-turn-helix domain-containing protein [Niabella sp. CC-SYL272]|uniref:helix-turn-helix domain-containing protein n=1 Tax=Niabella agricola TaxID=2891571 RepID=UPI001F37B770|nr:helix-turn-helix domain-containing protein [Niabella agricola]MCF3110797.1 helix-turn-helix domain-containing protein [Niabella agricola]
MERFLQTIILLGAMQGFIVSCLLFFSRRLRMPNRLLALLIFLLTLASFCLYGSYIGWFDSKWLNFLSNLIPLIVVMPVGPLLYFYVRSFLEPEFKIGRKEWMQFLPVIVDLGSPLMAWLFVAGVWTGLLKNDPRPWGIAIDTYNVYSDIPRWISLAFYTVLTLRYLAAGKQKNPAGFRWLQQVATVFGVFLCIWFVYLVPYVIPRYTGWMLDNLDWYPLYIPITLLIYWLGIKGYLVSWQQQVTEKKQDAALLPEPVVDAAIGLLKNTMEQDRLFLNTELTLQMVARHTGLAAKTISAVLNQHLQINFNEFVNRYRVALFKEKLLADDAAQLTFAGMAYDCGFNSPATFQRVFKQTTGMSPSEFRKNNTGSHAAYNSNRDLSSI